MKLRISEQSFMSANTGAEYENITCDNRNLGIALNILMKVMQVENL